MKNRFLFGYILSFLIIFSFAPIALAVAFPGYQPLANLPGLQSGSVPTEGGNLAPYLGNLYTMGVAAAAGLAVIMVIWGGVEYITSVAGEGKSGGKERITSAILGLLLALGSYIILNTINPDLLKLSFFLPDAEIKIGNPYTNDYNNTKARQDSAFQTQQNAYQNYLAAEATYLDFKSKSGLTANMTNSEIQQKYNEAINAWVQAGREYQTAQRNYDNLKTMTDNLLNLKAHYGQ